jgi:hypothetical protein
MPLLARVTAKTSAAIFKFRNMISSRRDSSDLFLFPAFWLVGCREARLTLHGGRISLFSS